MWKLLILVAALEGEAPESLEYVSEFDSRGQCVEAMADLWSVLTDQGYEYDYATAQKTGSFAATNGEYGIVMGCVADTERAA